MRLTETREAILERFLIAMGNMVIENTDPTEQFKELREAALECLAVAHRSRLLTTDIAAFHDDEIALVRRNSDAIAFPDWLALPGGHVNEGELERDAAFREFRERDPNKASKKHLSCRTNSGARSLSY